MVKIMCILVGIVVFYFRLRLIVLCIQVWRSIARMLVIVEPRLILREQYIHIRSVNCGDFAMESKICMRT
jgi:hypothetical protein